MKIVRSEIGDDSIIWATWYDNGDIYIGSNDSEVAVLIKADGTKELAEYWDTADEHVRLEVEWDEANNERTLMSDEQLEEFQTIIDDADAE